MCKAAGKIQVYLNGCRILHHPWLQEFKHKTTVPCVGITVLVKQLHLDEKHLKSQVSNSLFLTVLGRESITFSKAEKE